MATSKKEQRNANIIMAIVESSVVKSLGIRANVGLTFFKRLPSPIPKTLAAIGEKFSELPIKHYQLTDLHHTNESW